MQAFALALIFPHPMIRAQNVLVAPGSTSAATYKISGTIVSALDGTPLGLARVSLADAKNRDQSVWMITSENGHFEFSSIPAGKFSLEGGKKGFLSATYQQHEQFSTAIVTGAGLNTENLILRLSPLSMLSGKIVDESGDPVRTARVVVYVESHNAGVNRIRPACYDETDDQGYYECRRWLRGTITSASPRSLGTPCIPLPRTSTALATRRRAWRGRWTLRIRQLFTTARPTVMAPRLFPSMATNA
jgi:hypothetical protein